MLSPRYFDRNLVLRNVHESQASDCCGVQSFIHHMLVLPYYGQEKRYIRSHSSVSSETLQTDISHIIKQNG